MGAPHQALEQAQPRVIIIGGVAGGASTAARLRRLLEGAEILLIERSGYVSFANCGLPYHIGGVIAERQKLLLQSPESFRARYNIAVRVNTEALRIDRAERTVVLRELATGVERREKYDYLVLSPGAAPVRPPIPGIDLPGVFTLRNMADMDAIRAHVDKALAGPSPAPRALVVGGGYIGLEMAEALRLRGVPTVLVEMARQVMGPVDAEMAVPIQEELRAHAVDLRLGVQVTALRAETAGLAASCPMAAA